MMKLIQKRAAIRKRGLMAEVMLSLVVLSMVIVVMAVNSQRESLDQQDRMMAARTEILANAAKAYVGEQYDFIRETMTTTSGAVDPSEPAVMVLTMEELAEAGYLSDALISGGTGNDFGHDYRLFIRGVLRGDSGWPQSTLTMGQVVALNTADLNGYPLLTNGVYNASDDELDLESVLISEGGQPIGDGVVALRRGANVTSHSANPTMGFIQADPSTGELVAYGNLGAFQMPLAPWTDMGSTAQAGHFLTLVSLSDGSGSGAGGGGGSTDIRGALRRCEDLVDATEREICFADGNDMYSNIVFNTVAGADYSEYPGIEGLKKIACREADATGSPSGLVEDDTDLLYIDCATVQVSDNLTVQGGDLLVEQGDVSIENGTLVINGNEISNNLIMAQGQGLNGQTLPAAPITDEMCPRREDGTARSFKVQAWVSGLIEPVGRPIAGYRISMRTAGNPRGMSLAENPDPATGQFIADVITFVNEDHCTNVISGNILEPNNVAGTMTDSDFTPIAGEHVFNACLNGGSTSPDTYPDAYFLNDNYATVNYAVYCE